VTRPLLLLPFLAGCGPDVLGWWDITYWSVELAGAKDEVVDDGGFLTWQDTPYGSFSMALSYTYDPATVSLVSDPDPELNTSGTPLHEIDFKDDDPDDLSIGFPLNDTDWFTVEFEVVKDRANTMRLESVYSSDGSAWIWELTR
jgi:hypothetical protein